MRILDETPKSSGVCVVSWDGVTNAIVLRALMHSTPVLRYCKAALYYLGCFYEKKHELYLGL